MDPVLDPLLGRNTIKKGRYIKMGDKEVEYNPTFRLILQTKLANPHYQPEMQAQTTLINFTVTRYQRALHFVWEFRTGGWLCNEGSCGSTLIGFTVTTSSQMPLFFSELEDGCVMKEVMSLR